MRDDIICASHTLYHVIGNKFNLICIMKIYFADNGNLIRKTLISQIVRYMVLMAPLVILGLWDWLLNKYFHIDVSFDVKFR